MNHRVLMVKNLLYLRQEGITRSLTILSFSLFIIRISSIEDVCRVIKIMIERLHIV